MSSLEKNIDIFKKKLSKRNILTEDDITELESHIIDKVDDLKRNGLDENDAFNQAVSDLGPIDEIAAEYSKVNLSANTKFMLLCFGYFSISLVSFLVTFLTLFASYFIKNMISSYDYTYIPLLTPLMKFYHYDYSSYAMLFIFLINTALIILLLFFMLKKNNDFLSLISDKILSIQNSKPIVKIILSLLLISAPLLLNSIYSYMLHDFSYSYTFNILLNNFNDAIIGIVLISLLTIRYINGKALERSSSYMILGYLLTLVMIRCIPSLVLDISILAGQFNIICISILFISFFVITFYLIRKIIKNHILEKKPGIIPAALLVVIFIGSYFIRPHVVSLDYTLYSECMIKFANLSFMVQFCVNLLAAACIFLDYKLSFHKKRSVV